MNIKLKLALQFTLLVSIILIFFAGLIYYFFYDSQVGKFREGLAETSSNTAVLLINVVEVDSALLQKIQQATSSREQEEIIITDTVFKVLYSKNPDLLTTEVMNQNLGTTTTHYFSLMGKDGVCYRHKFAGNEYYVFVMAYDRSRRENLKELREVLLWGIVISVVLSIYLSYIFSRRAIWPITRLIESINKINSSKLYDRLHEGNRKDEIAQLAISFNKMLSDIESSFRNQEDFISNASHELRTPLSVMMLESDYLLTRERTPQEYIAHIEGQMEDIRNLNSMLNSLLEMAHLNSENILQFSDVSLDEIVFTAIKQVKAKFTDRKIVPRINYPESDSALLIKGNSGLLIIAFKNLIENACKFSDDEVVIQFDISKSEILVSIIDKGIGIPEGQLKDVFSPFKRGSNVKYKSGFGIGLSLVARILELHGILITVTTIEDRGTSVELKFNRI